MKIPLLLALVAASACASVPAAPLQGPEEVNDVVGNLEVLFGVRSLDEDTYGKVDDQVVLGLVMTTQRVNWPLELEFGLHFSADDDGDYHHGHSHRDVEGSNFELSVGGRKLFGEYGDPVRTYLGAGAALVLAEYDNDEDDIGDDDTVGGVYMRAGVVVSTWGPSAWGLDLRLFQGEDVDLGLDGDDSSYWQLSLFLGHRDLSPNPERRQRQLSRQKTSTKPPAS